MPIMRNDTFTGLSNNGRIIHRGPCFARECETSKRKRRTRKGKV
jgi:hypothetical protein